MFYALSKLLDLTFSPLSWALALGLAALALAGRRPRLSRVLGALALLTLYLPSTGGCAAWLFAYVERFDGSVVAPGVRYDAVVLLGGFIERRDGKDELDESADRLLRAWEMVRDGRAARVVIAGGSDTGVAEADLAADLLVQMGTDPARILRDTKSRNTRENATALRDIVRAEKLGRLALVTSAFHMERALGCLRAVGLEADALATDHQVPRVRGVVDALAPRAHLLAKSELALRELAGRLVYRLRGYAR
ncbi:MAG: YdcF family protein [Polyangiales bacterium]